MIEELKRMGIQYIVAPYEADAQLAYLEKKGIINVIILIKTFNSFTWVLKHTHRLNMCILLELNPLQATFNVISRKQASYSIINSFIPSIIIFLSLLQCFSLTLRYYTFGAHYRIHIIYYYTTPVSVCQSVCLSVSLCFLCACFFLLAFLFTVVISMGLW